MKETADKIIQDVMRSYPDMHIQAHSWPSKVITDDGDEQIMIVQIILRPMAKRENIIRFPILFWLVCIMFSVSVLIMLISVFI